MSWLKHNSQSSEVIKRSMEPKLIVPETPNMQDFVTGSNPVKRRKPRRSKSKPETSKDTKADIASADTSKNADSKHLGTDTEDSRKQGKKNPKFIPSSKITVTSCTVWNAKSNAATTLFPEAQSASVQIIDEDIELEKVLKNSILTAKLEQFRLNEDSKVNWADELEDPEWNSGCYYQLETFYDKDKDTEKIEKKSHDNNNNDNNSISSKEDSKTLDNYGKSKGYRDQQTFTEKEAHTKEQQMLRHENHSMGSFNQRQSTSVPEKSICNYSQKINPYDNRNRGQRDHVDNRSNDDTREYRNRNFQTFNQRGRFDNQNHSHRYDNHPQKYDNQPQRHDNQHQIYNNQQQRNEVQQQYNNQPYRYDNQFQRHDNQQRRFENNRYGNNQHRDFPSKGQHQYSNSHKEEIRGRDSNEFQDNKEDLIIKSNQNNTLNSQQPSEKEKEEKPELEPEVIPDVKPDIEDILEISNSNTLTMEDDPSFTFMQSINKDECCENAVKNNDLKFETASEQNEYPDTQTVAPNPYTIRQVPFQVIHPSGTIYQTPEGFPIHNGTFSPPNMSTLNKQPGAIPYNVITNPFIGSALSPQQFQHQHTHEILENGCTTVPMQNFDMRLYHQSPFIHNHPIMPMGMSSCGHVQQIPVGNLPGMNYMQQHLVNCQQCPSHFCQSQPIPIQNLNCQSPIYPQFANVMTPMGPVLTPITCANQEQIIPQLRQNPYYVNNSQADKMGVTPATVIEKSANNLVNLCENLPSRRGSYPTNCPPGFESSLCASHKRIICEKGRNILPSFRNMAKEYAQEKSRRISKKTEEFSDERLAGIYDTIFDTTKSQNFEKEEVMDSFKCSELSKKCSKGSFEEQLLKSNSNSEENPIKSKDIQAPRPGIRLGIGRGKKIIRAD